MMVPVHRPAAVVMVVTCNMCGLPAAAARVTGAGCRVEGGTDTFLQGFCQSLAHLPPRNTAVHCHSIYQYHCHLLADI